jgi:hypothetical protein
MKHNLFLIIRINKHKHCIFYIFKSVKFKLDSCYLLSCNKVRIVVNVVSTFIHIVSDDNERCPASITYLRTVFDHVAVNASGYTQP